MDVDKLRWLFFAIAAVAMVLGGVLVFAALLPWGLFPVSAGLLVLLVLGPMGYDCWGTQAKQRRRRTASDRAR